MIEVLNFETIMEEHEAKNKIKGGDTKVVTVYEVFKGTGKFVSTTIHKRCSKTACDIACWISDTMMPSQTSIKFNSRTLIESSQCNAKTPDTIRKAIKELVNVGAIVKWKDIEGLPNNVEVTNDWYLLNPQMIKCIGCDGFRSQCETTLKAIRNSQKYLIHEYSAIVYDFSKKQYDFNNQIIN